MNPIVTKIISYLYTEIIYKKMLEKVQSTDPDWDDKLLEIVDKFLRGALGI